MDCPEFVYRAAQLWVYPVILACILLLVPAFTSAYWNEGIIQKLTGKRKLWLSLASRR